MRMRSIGSCATCASCTRTGHSCLTSDTSSLWVRSLERSERSCACANSVTEAFACIVPRSLLPYLTCLLLPQGSNGGYKVSL